jgi:hypothetical protein
MFFFKKNVLMNVATLASIVALVAFGIYSLNNPVGFAFVCLGVYVTRF